LSAVERPRAIADSDPTQGFDCGHTALNDWLKTRALRNERGGASRTFVTVEDAVGVAGYYCLAAGAIDAASAPARLKRNMPAPVPVVLLGRLAVDVRFQGRGLGAALLRDALARSAVAARTIGARAVIVHPLNDEVADFYARFRFEPLAVGNSSTMYLLLQDIEQSLASIAPR